MKTLPSLFLFVFLMFNCKKADTPPAPKVLNNGIPYEMAVLRKNQISDIHYKLEFKIPEHINTPIASKLELSATLKTVKHPLYLDFNADKTLLKTLFVNGKEIPITHNQQHIIIDPSTLNAGKNCLTIHFNAGELSLNRNNDFLYTLLVPDRASTLFPCFDQPDLKANYTLSITAPKTWKVLCGAPEIAQEEETSGITHHFEETDKMSTYLFSFVAGVFNETNQVTDGFPMTLLYRENNKEKQAESIPEIFNLHKSAVDFLETYTNYPFPFKKLDFATIPIFQYGGMEHVGAVQYRESHLFFDKNATESQKLSRGKLIAHETAHMWFGDLVTMKWFDDVWMKEVFANFMADKIMNPVFKNTNHNLLFMTNHYPSAYSEDRTAGTNPIKQKLKNLNNAGSLYGRIIYNKAPIMMRQLETVMGKEQFKLGIQDYIKTFADDNAEWNDLVSILDKKTPIDLKLWSKVWVNASSRPIISESISYDNDTISQFTLNQKAEDGSNNTWPQRFSIGFIYPEGITEIPVSITGKNTVIKQVVGLKKPLGICYNYNGLGYGVFPINTYIASKINSLKNPVARGYSYINLYENMLIGKITPSQAISYFKTGLEHETNEHLIKLISNYTRTLFWRFLTPKQQVSIQNKLLESIQKRLNQTATSNLKKTFFNTFKSFAYSKKGLAIMYAIWTKKTSIKNLNLNEDDFTALAQTLALFNHPERDHILKTAEKAITNPDKLKKFQFLKPALSNDLETRKALFLSFKNSKNREKEAWVSEANNFIHHPIHNEALLNELPLSLNLLDEIQKTGDIFFPKSWLASTIGNYSSKKAYLIFQKFLNKHPHFNPILKKKLLQTTDNLVRAQKIKKD